MTRHEILCKISYYEWLISSTNLNYKHEVFLQGEIKKLIGSLEQFHEKERASK